MRKMLVVLNARVREALRAKTHLRRLELDEADTCDALQPGMKCRYISTKPSRPTGRGDRHAVTLRVTNRIPFLGPLRAATWMTAVGSLACSSGLVPPDRPSRGGPAWYEVAGEHFVLRTDMRESSGRRMFTLSPAAA
jgi:hypothetical protein